MVYVFTAEERILVHLLPLIKHEDSFESPIGVTQYGIGLSIDAGQDYVSRALKRLKQKELVVEKRSRVEGVRERRKVYFLTMAGIQEAQKIKERMRGTVITVKGEGGQDRKMSVGELKAQSKENLSELDIIRFTTEAGECRVLDIREKRAADRVVDLSDKAPKLRHFFGREQERQNIIGWLKTHKVIVIHGIAGMGKTALVAKVVEQYKGERNLMWYKLHEWDTLTGPLEQLAELLTRINRRRLRTYLQSKLNIDMTELGYILEEELKDANILLVFDDFHKASRPIIQLFSVLVEILERIKGVQIILTTRYPMLFYDRREVMIKKIVAELNLKGLDEGSSNQLLESRNIAKDLYHDAYELTEGHPLSLELIEADGVKRKMDLHINKYIEEEIFSKLSGQEKAMLKIASVYRYPVQPKGLFIDDSLVYETLTGLVERGLIQELSYESFDLHDFIREFFYCRLTPKERLGLHSKAADYYLDMEGHRAWFESLYHLVNARKVKEAAKIAVEKGWELISKGYLEEFQTLLNDINFLELDDGTRGELHLVSARISDITGEWDNALDNYKRALELIKEPARQVVSFWNIGWILQKRNDWEGAMDNFRKCLELSEELKDTRSTAEAYHGMGRVAWREGHLKDAEDFLRKSLAFAEETDDRDIMASAYIELGRVLCVMGKLEEGRKCFEESLSVLKQLENPFETSRAYNCLGWEYFREKGDWERAKESMIKGMLIARDVGYTEGLGPVCHSLGEFYSRSGDFKKAEQYLNESEEVFKKLGDDHGLAYNYLSRGVMGRLQKKWEESEDYYMMALNYFEEVGTPFDTACAAYEFGLALKDKGDPKGARMYLDKARAIFQAMGAKIYLERTVKELDALGGHAKPPAARASAARKGKGRRK